MTQGQLRVESLDLSAARVAALKEALEKQVANGKVTALAQGAVQDAYNKTLEGLQTSAVYSDSEFPASEASIWGHDWQTRIEERVAVSVQWVRPDVLLKNVQAREEVLKSALSAFAKEEEEEMTTGPRRGRGVLSPALRTQLAASQGKQSTAKVAAASESAHEGGGGTAAWSDQMAREPSKEDMTLGLKRGKRVARLPSAASGKMAPAGEGGVIAVAAGGKPVVSLSLIGASGHEVLQGRGVAGVGCSSFVAAVWLLAAGKDFAARIRALFLEKRSPPMSSRLACGCHSVTLFVRGE